MPKRHQQYPGKQSAGRNNPKKSTEIITGPPKKHETYEQQAIEHDNPAKLAQRAKVPPERDPTMGRTHEADRQAQMEERVPRSGSDSNASKSRKWSKNHLTERGEKQPQPPPESHEAEQVHDLAVAHHQAQNLGMGEPAAAGFSYSAHEFKQLYPKLADLTDDELKSIQILPTGTRLEEGATYIDLNHLEEGEFVAHGNQVASPDNYYVPKKATGYVLWNRLRQVSEPERLDENPPREQ
ncbi:MAG: hypothetical protein IMW89_08490 [Ktedonobacteraceae bacterium]|nr:hypothetical protein [Ktedonobacteraceae bacterium]